MAASQRSVEQCRAPGSTDTHVHGKCVCQHNTAGDHCERCAPLYSDQPWRPGDGKTGAPNECKRCRCHSHALSCRFDLSVWLSSGRRSGGVCENCQHNTEGYHCQRCKSGYYRDRREPISSPAACKACSCHPVGSANETLHRSWKCHPKTGFCYCKPGVAGPYCDHCLMGYWGFGDPGCSPCDCARDCDLKTGECRTRYMLSSNNSNASRSDESWARPVCHADRRLQQGGSTPLNMSAFQDITASAQVAQRVSRTSD
ncbi:hypothetical protein FKM82_004410 [Ascaphus truei]